MEKFYTTKEAAEALRLSHRTVARYCREGRLAHSRLGDDYRIPESEIHRLLGVVPAVVKPETGKPQFSQSQIQRALLLVDKMKSKTRRDRPAALAPGVSNKRVR